MVFLPVFLHWVQLPREWGGSQPLAGLFPAGSSCGAALCCPAHSGLPLHVHWKISAFLKTLGKTGKTEIRGLGSICTPVSNIPTASIEDAFTSPSGPALICKD